MLQVVHQGRKPSGTQIRRIHRGDQYPHARGGALMVNRQYMGGEHECIKYSPRVSMFSNSLFLMENQEGVRVRHELKEWENVPVL